jgi:hypothetical protein
MVVSEISAGSYQDSAAESTSTDQINTYEDIDPFTCMVSEGSTFFDLRPLVRTNDAYYSVDDFRFNFCTYVSLLDTDAIAQDMQYLESYAFITDAAGIIRPLTESNSVPDKTTAILIEGSGSEFDGVHIEYMTNEVCSIASGAIQHYGFIAEIYCVPE